MVKKCTRVALIVGCALFMLSETHPLNSPKPGINITYDNPQLNFNCFMDALVQKATLPALRAATQIGVGGFCACLGIGLLRAGINTLAQSFSPPSSGAGANDHKKGAITYLIGGSVLTAAGLWLMWTTTTTGENNVITEKNS